MWVLVTLLFLVGLSIYLIARRTTLTLEGKGTVSRAPIRMNIPAEQVSHLLPLRKQADHVAFTYKPGVQLFLNGQPAQIFGYKDKHAYGPNDHEYGYIISDDSKIQVYFEALAPMTARSGGRFHHTTTQYLFRGVKGVSGTGVGTLEYRATPVGGEKTISLTGTLHLS